MIPNIVKGRGFRGLANYLLEHRKQARIVGGNMVGETPRELAREFGICRRLRPRVQMPVMHHTLSFAGGEDPGDQLIAQIAESYIRKMHLENHQWCAVVHRDKPHVHVHLAVNRIALDGKWWNATHDQERSQVIAGQVEIEFGLVQVPRVRLREAIRKSVSTERIQAPQVPVVPPIQEVPPKTVLSELRARMESLPHGLTAPDWIRAAKEVGVTLKPSIGGTKVSGFTATLPGHRAVKISEVHRSLSWPSLLKTGRVVYDPENHFETLARILTKEPVHEATSSPGEPESDDLNPDPDDYALPGGGTAYLWQPVPPRLVAVPVDQGMGADAPESDGRPTVLRTALAPGEPHQLPASEPSTTGHPTGESQDERSAARILDYGSSDSPTPGTEDIDLGLPGDGPGQHLLGDHPEFRSGDGHHRDHGIDAAGADAWPQGSPVAEAPVGGLPLSRRRSFARGGLPDAPSVGTAGDRRRAGRGLRLRRDAGGLTGAIADIEAVAFSEDRLDHPAPVLAAEVIAAEEGELIHPLAFQKKVEERLELWRETDRARLTGRQYLQAKALVASVADQLAPARAVMRMLGGAPAMPAPRKVEARALDSASNPPGPEGDIDLSAQVHAGRLRRGETPPQKSLRFEARSAEALVGYRVDREALEVGRGRDPQRVDQAAQRVIAAEAGGLLHPRLFRARVEARLRLWREAEELGHSEDQYRATKSLRGQQADVLIMPPAPPSPRVTFGVLGWHGPECHASELVGCRTDWQDTMDPDEFPPTDLHRAARRLVAQEASRPLRPKEFALKAEVREGLWAEAKVLDLTPEVYRQVREHILSMGSAPHLDQEALRAVVRARASEAGHTLDSELPDIPPINPPPTSEKIPRQKQEPGIQPLRPRKPR